MLYNILRQKIFNEPAYRHGLARSWPTSSYTAISGLWFRVACLAVTILVIITTSLLAGITYHQWGYGHNGSPGHFANTGILVALAYAIQIIFHDELGTKPFFNRAKRLYRTFTYWNRAILALVVIALLMKTTESYSRITLLLYYFMGFGSLLAVQTLFNRLYLSGLASGFVMHRRVMILETQGRHSGRPDSQTTMQPDSKAVYRGCLPSANASGKEFDKKISEHTARARRLNIDDVVIQLGLSELACIDTYVDAFSLLPVSIHIKIDGLLDKYTHAEIGLVGDIPALSLGTPPLGPFQAVLKRALDIVLATIGLLVLSPLILVIAIMIKRDSAGNVFFKQRRTGYNKQEFVIYKFRTMSSTDDGAIIVQAKQGDKRITRIGAWLRATNLDELPQLFNVIRGDMSVIGPRPHAVAHDHDFEKRVIHYPRRSNMRPGITGWAQVNGYRGETDTDEKIVMRIKYDLDYIDRWSLALDIRIIFLTLFSPQAYRNAR